MKRRRSLWGALIPAFLVGVPATPYATEKKAEAGQPFCQRLEDLQPYVMALLEKNLDEMHRYDCGGLPRGIRLVILENLPSETDAGHVAHVRAYLLGGGGSISGYTLVITP